PGDLHAGAGLGPAGDDEDITVGFDVFEVKLRRGLVAVAAVAAERGDAELPRLAPRPLDAVLAIGGHPPLEGPFTAQPERRPRLRPVVDVDDVVDEQMVARHL